MKLLKESRVLRKAQYKPFAFFPKYHKINSLYLTKTIPICHEDTYKGKELSINQSKAPNN